MTNGYILSQMNYQELAEFMAEMAFKAKELTPSEEEFDSVVKANLEWLNSEYEEATE